MLWYTCLQMIFWCCESVLVKSKMFFASFTFARFSQIFSGIFHISFCHLREKLLYRFHFLLSKKKLFSLYQIWLLVDARPLFEKRTEIVTQRGLFLTNLTICSLASVPYLAFCWVVRWNWCQSRHNLHIFPPSLSLYHAFFSMNSLFFY